MAKNTKSKNTVNGARRPLEDIELNAARHQLGCDLGTFVMGLCARGYAWGLRELNDKRKDAHM